MKCQTCGYDKERKRRIDMITLGIILVGIVLVPLFFWENSKINENTRACEEVRQDRNFCFNAFSICNLDLGTIKNSGMDISR